MDKGWGPPTLHAFAFGQGLGAPPNPSRFEPASNWTKVWGGSPNPSRLERASKWTRVAGPPTLHGLQMDKGWGPPSPSRLERPPNGQRLGAPPTLHELQMDKGWGPPELCMGGLGAGMSLHYSVLISARSVEQTLNP